MSVINRREFTRLIAGAGIAALSPVLLRSAVIGKTVSKTSARVVVIGGGAGGASVAAILKRGAPHISVTVIEPHKIYTTCFNSNHYFGGFRTLASLQHSYDGLRKLGIDVVSDLASDIDTTKRIVKLAGGKELAYDRLVISPGIDFKFDAIAGYSAQVATESMPHAWKAGPQTLMLKKQLEAMDDGGVVIMAVPNNPYRCPPGPYERACMIAHFLKTKKPKSKLVILDAKKTFSKQPAFEEAFAKYYGGIIDLNLTNEIDDFRVVRVDPSTREVVTQSGTKMKGAVVNIIPPQRAGDIAAKAGCVEGDWCPVTPANFASAKVKDVYVVGTRRSPPRCPSRPSRPTARPRAPLLTFWPTSLAPSGFPRTIATPAGRSLPPTTASRSVRTTSRARRTARRSWSPPSRSSRRRAKPLTCASRTMTRASPGIMRSSRMPSTTIPRSSTRAELQRLQTAAPLTGKETSAR